MSLQVWLPLINDVHNQGLLSNVSVAEYGTTIDNNGKIGKCYSFDGEDDYLQLNNIGSALNGLSEMSFGFWCYSIEGNLSKIFCIRNGSHQISFGTENLNFRDSKHSNLEYIAITQPSPNTWTHYMFVYNNGSWIIYKDGIKDVEKSYSTAKLNNWSEFRIGRNTDSSGSTYFSGKINDFRIYDHALSPKEVEEISKGLVLQYQLNNGGGGNPNLIPSSTITNGAYQRFPLTENLQANQPYTLQLWNVMVSNPSVDNLGIVVCWGGKNIVLTSVIGEDYFSYYEDNDAETNYLKCTFTPTEEDAALADANKQFLDIYNSEPVTTARSKYFEIGAWKLEKGTIATPWVDANVTISTTVYDTSGYANNGTINGVLTTSAGSPRYHVATNFSDFTNYITTPSLGLTECSYSMWVRPSADTTVGMVFSDYLSGICFGRGESYVYCHNNIALNPNNRYIRSTIANDDTWQHFVVCRTATGEINLYKNGELVSPNHTSASGFNHYETDQLLIGRRIGANQQDSTAYSIKGDIVDFREYATILTPAQIKELYLTSMIVNADGTTSPRELVN